MLIRIFSLLILFWISMQLKYTDYCPLTKTPPNKLSLLHAQNSTPSKSESSNKDRIVELKFSPFGPEGGLEKTKEAKESLDYVRFALESNSGNVFIKEDLIRSIELTSTKEYYLKNFLFEEKQKQINFQKNVDKLKELFLKIADTILPLLSVTIGNFKNSDFNEKVNNLLIFECYNIDKKSLTFQSKNFFRQLSIEDFLQGLVEKRVGRFKIYRKMAEALFYANFLALGRKN